MQGWYSDFYITGCRRTYVSENKKAFEIVESGIRRLPYIHMLSIGCGPSPDLFGIIDFLNILIMQYLLSHVVYNQRQGEIDEFFDNLIEHVIMKMEPKSYIIINDINHNLARDRFELLEKKIERKGKKIKVYKYYFRYKPDLNVFQTAGMVRHESNTIDYFIEPCIQERNGARMDCRSVQHIIEVDDL